MQAPGDESALITRAQRGDKIAIGMLYSNHVQAIYKYVRYRVDTDGLAEDITSEVFLRMVRQLPRYTYTGAPFSAWLYRIAANCITDAFRGQYAHVVEELPDEVADDQPDPLDTLTLAEDHDQLRQALQTLSPDYQNILILRFMNDVSHAEVAAAMDRTEAAVRVLQHRALKALADALRSIPVSYTHLTLPTKA
jgi:RNA polymerase sigma-70 factor (ECF subfamily)